MFISYLGPIVKALLSLGLGLGIVVYHGERMTVGAENFSNGDHGSTSVGCQLIK